MFKLFLTPLFFITICLSAKSQVSNLLPGDIAIVALQTDNSDQFAFLSLVDIDSTTKIQFSEKGWNGSLAQPAFVNSSEAIHTWTAPSNGIGKGTVVTVTFSSTGKNPVANFGTISSTAASGLSTSGDQLIAYQGTLAAPVFIYAISSRPWINTGNPTTTQSWLPQGLINGLTARDFPTEINDQYFKLTPVADTKDGILKSIGNIANWTRSNTRFASLPVWQFSFMKAYYSKAIGNISDTSSWGVKTDGSGQMPSGFKEPSTVYHIANRTDTIQLTSDWQVGKLTIDKNILLSLNGFLLSMESLMESTEGKLLGGINSQLSITGSSGPVKFDSATAILRNLILTKNASLNLQESLQIAGGLDEGSVSLADSAILNSNGFLILCSDEKGAANIAPLGSGASVQGEVQVQKYIPAGKRNFRFLAHPFSHSIGLNMIIADIDISGSGGKTNGFTKTGTNNPSAFWYDPFKGNGAEKDTGWIAFDHTNGLNKNAWNSTEGIRINIRGKKGEGLNGAAYKPSAVTMHFKGQLNNGAKIITLSKNAINPGFNLVGNPYASCIDMSKLQIGNNVMANYYVWDPNQGTKGGYACYPFSSKIILPAFSAFFVQVMDTSSGNTIQFSENSKQPGADPAQIFGQSNHPMNQLELALFSDSVFYDKQVIIFKTSASDSIDRFDAIKMMNPECNLYSISSEKEKLTIDTRKAGRALVIPLGLISTMDRSFTLKATQVAVMDGFALILHDKKKNITTIIKPGFKYDFSIDSTEQYQTEERFEIIVSAVTNSNQTEAINKFSSLVFPNPANNQFIVKVKAPVSLKLSIQVLNESGQLIQLKELRNVQEAVVELDCKNWSKGIYFLKLSTGEETVIHKIIKL